MNLAESESIGGRKFCVNAERSCRFLTQVRAPDVMLLVLMLELCLCNCDIAAVVSKSVAERRAVS